MMSLQHLGFKSVPKNVLHDAHIYGRSPREKPLITEQNRLKRLEFAKEYINKLIDFSKNVIFSDESKFNIFKSDGRKLVWRKPCTDFHTKNVLPTVEHGGGSVMIWGCMASKGVGNLCFIDGLMTARTYTDVLQDNLPQSAIKLGISNSYYFQQDNDPKHSAGITRMWLFYRVPRKLATPPRSPYLNPLENLWNSLDLKIRKRKISIKYALKQALIEKWSNTDPTATENLIKSMLARLQARASLPYTAGLQWYWARTRDKASHDPMHIPLGYRGHYKQIKGLPQGGPPSNCLANV
ncbi:transposable element Tcb1 transposase [Trichonephila clavipes]|nr:transposable element Tcb1 transposase [Trichonephila clavipes]